MLSCVYLPCTLSTTQSPGLCLAQGVHSPWHGTELHTQDRKALCPLPHVAAGSPSARRLWVPALLRVQFFRAAAACAQGSGFGLWHCRDHRLLWLFTKNAPKELV